MDLKEIVSMHPALVESSLRRDCNAGRFKEQARQVSWGKRSKWQMHGSAIKTLIGEPSADYENLIEEWKQEQSNGYHTGKPLGHSVVDNNQRGLKRYWDVLALEPSIENINAEMLRKAFASIEVDYEGKKCSYGKRSGIYKGVLSFTKLLIRRGLKTEADLIALKKNVPRRVFPAKFTVLEGRELMHLIKQIDACFLNDKRVMAKTLVMTAAFAGVRRQELVDLKINHINLSAGIISVIDGKGHKDREIGIVPELGEQLSYWLTLRKPVDHDYLFTSKGKPLGTKYVNSIISLLAGKAGIKITPHGLRMTFATLMANRGMPLSLIQISLGHEDVRTTQGYIKSTSKQAAEWLQNYGNAPPKEVHKPYEQKQWPEETPWT